MADRGLIERIPGPGRAVRHRLTDEGARLRTEGQVIMKSILRESFHGLAQAELDKLGALLNKALGPDPVG
ncbi:hypothetical protein AB0G83_17720 [Streptomyces klenkii]|uniref:hypothetical protein n=1 Tax=Streptomyces TaxID=1883 RepID=UPI0018F739E9|nr:MULTISPECIES: hypothetical protein [Streptomyces]